MKISAACIASFVLLAVVASAQRPTRVSVIKAPFHGFRPQAFLDGEGTLHVVSADATSRGDVFYTRRARGSQAFSPRIRVNSEPGIVAGFSMAVGKNGRVHVLMRTNPKYSKLKMPDKKKLRIFDLKYMLYTRLDGSHASFEPERNLAGETLAFEGMGVVLADQAGVVRAFWHGQLEQEFNEAARRIYTAVSTDDGATFSTPRAIETDVVGACQCCSMAGLLGAKGEIYLGFRNASPFHEVMTKDSYLLTSEDGGATFQGRLLGVWRRAGCPGSLCSLAETRAGVWAAWRTESRLRLAPPGDFPAPFLGGDRALRRAPLVVANRRGEVLFVWSETVAGPRRGADLRWRVFAADGTNLPARGRLPRGIAARFGAAAAYARPDGDFVILHDGEPQARRARVIR